MGVYGWGLCEECVCGRGVWGCVCVFVYSTPCVCASQTVCHDTLTLYDLSQAAAVRNANRVSSAPIVCTR